MKNFKSYLERILTIFILLFISNCDDREPEDVNVVVNGVLEIQEIQPVCCFDDSQINYFGVEVGEVVSGSSILKLVLTLKNESGVLQKGKEINFTDNIGDKTNDEDYFINGKMMVTDDNGEVLQYYKPNSSIEKIGNDLAIITVSYGTNTSISTSFEIHKDQTDVWPYSLILNADPDIIKLDNGVTTSNIEAKLFNSEDPPKQVKNVQINYSSNKGFFNQVSDTTNNLGVASLVFKDNGTQSDIGTAQIICTYLHPAFNESIAETINVNIGSQNTLSIDVTPVAVTESAQIIVGEDIVGDIVKSRIIATVTDTSGNPRVGQILNFSAMVLGQDVGEIILSSNVTDNQGQVYAYFIDNGGYVDIIGTSEFEGVTLTVYLGDLTSTTLASAQFNVYSEELVWPYTLFLNSDVDRILLDNGVTEAQIEAELRNRNNDLIKNVALSFSSDRGTIAAIGSTNEEGLVSLTFSDNGTQEELGLANIIASFSHPGFPSATIIDSIQVSINTNNSIVMEIIHISYDETGATFTVGEDIAGNYASTLLVATVVDSSGVPASGVPVQFKASSNSQTVGLITYSNEVSNVNGQVVGTFDDNNNVYKDNPGTPNYEGVSVYATFGNQATLNQNFNVYSTDDIWPYNLILTTDTESIFLDGGSTSAKISSRLLNRIGEPIKNAQINYSSLLGSIISTGFTDSLGADTVIFSDLGNPEDVGVSDIKATFTHPGFSNDIIQDSLQVLIEDESFQSCAFMEIPSSNPGQIVVKDGGGIESTIIRAEVYDDNGNLINTPTPVVFTMSPRIGDAYLDSIDDDPETATVYTVNGIASVSVNSGTDPGPIRIEATCDCDQDGSVDLTSVTVPVIITSGAPYYIESEYDPNSTEAIGGGFYQTECAAIVYDKWYNPVEDSTYVYWNISPLPPATGIDAFVEGVSFTNNEGVLSGTATPGVARSNIVYSTDAIGAIGQVRALTFGANGDSVVSFVNEGEGNATLFFLPGQVSLLSNSTYYDFSLNVNPARIQVSALVIDFYGNPVVGAPVSFNGTGVNAFYEIGYEAYDDFGIDTTDVTDDAGEGDFCFTWRDYGKDDDPSTIDEGSNNDDHDSFLDSLGTLENSEVSENFDDYGLDGIDNTFDEGEGDGKWNGYSMINCEPVVKTDSDGYARITVEFDQALCTLANIDDTTDPSTCSYDDFTASLSATLLIPEITSSDPLDILLVRSPAPCE